MKSVNLISMLAMITFLHCGKGGSGVTPPPTPPDTSPTISSIAPDNGPFNTSVVITGTHFSAVAAENEVSFNGKAATVSSATATSLTVIVPKGAGTGNVSVKVKSKTASGPVFNYAFTATVSTLAGSVRGFKNGAGAQALFNWPRGICSDNQGNIYVGDYYNNMIRKITPAGEVSTLAGAGDRGYINGAGAAAKFWNPQGVCADASGNIYVGDQGNDVVRKVTPSGNVTTYAGSTVGYLDGPTGSAKFFNPEEVAIDAAGNVYVADANNYKVRKITVTGNVSTVAGSTYGNEDGTVTTVKFYTPRGLWVEPDGAIYVADCFNHRIRKIKDGMVTTFAGTDMGYLDGVWNIAKFNFPKGITGDGKGNFYVVEEANNTIRKITSAGLVSTFSGKIGYQPVIDKDGPVAEATFQTPSAICRDPQGNLFIADHNNHRIRKITFE